MKCVASWTDASTSLCARDAAWISVIAHAYHAQHAGSHDPRLLRQQAVEIRTQTLEPRERRVPRRPRRLRVALHLTQLPVRRHGAQAHPPRARRGIVRATH